MAIGKELLDFIQLKDDLLVMLWDKNQGWKPVSSTCSFLADADVLSMNLDELRNIIIEDDQKIYDIFVEKIKAGMEGASDRIGINENRVNVTVRMKNQTGIEYYNVECHLKKDANNAIIKMMVMVYELDTEEIYRIKMAQKVSADRNPTVFMERAKERIGGHPDKKYAVIQFDIVKFKVINEMYGEARGDEILDYFTDVLKVLCGKERLYSRLSADVFMILTDYESIDDIYRFVDILNQNLSGFKGMTYRLVYGVAFVTDIREGLRKYGDGAALARQNIKGDALCHIAFYEESMKESIFTKKFIEDNMVNALENREFVMYLQPKYNISDEKIVGAEALVRWIHPEKGIIPPMDFVPLFEKNGFIVKMDQYIWEEACKTIRAWMDEGKEPLPISVNVSRRNLRNQEFIQVLDGLIEKYQIPKKYLEIEITESIEESEMNQGITLLKDSSYTLLMDDFGSGYSSLNMLKDTKFDVIKIDRGFLQDFIGSDRGQKIVEHTIKMTKAIGLDMVAEGVETKEQAVFLDNCGCDTAQGFYYAKPMTLQDFNALFNEIS